MTLNDKFEWLQSQCNPRHQVVCIHKGMRNNEGTMVVEPRQDQDGLPALDIKMKKNEVDWRAHGWEPFVPPAKPTVVKKARK